jgi:cell wall-associated NlpC family hydrolase
VLKKDYYTIVKPAQLGDLVLLSTRNDAVVHAAVYVADDLVFTKNGESYTQPWILMRMEDMLDTYNVRYPSSGPVTRVCFRLKSL